MSHQCISCSFILKPVDTHDTCVFHSTCFSPPYFDPRNCQACIDLFDKARSDPQAFLCWQSRLKSLEQHPDLPVLHPEAVSFTYLTDPLDVIERAPEEGVPVVTKETAPVNPDVTLKTLELLEKLNNSLNK